MRSDDFVTERMFQVRRFINMMQSAVIILLMCGIMASLGILIGGIEGLIWALALGLFIFILSPRFSPALMLRMYRASAIPAGEAAELYAITAQLASKAGIAKVPVLFYIPSRIMNAFSVGNREDSAIALTDGLLRALDWNEMTGVLAHEMSHIGRDDLKIMGLADSLTRFTLFMANIGMLLLIIYLPLFFIAGVQVPFLLILIMIFAPRLSILLQLALSRTREFDADLNAVKITGDPTGLASALKKIDTYSPSVWDALIMPGRKVPAPSVLRTHPQTDKRVERLLKMKGETDYIVYPHHLFGMVPKQYQQVKRQPRWKFFGLWH
jgi:heat shock protein HtpX